MQLLARDEVHVVFAMLQSPVTAVEHSALATPVQNESKSGNGSGAAASPEELELQPIAAMLTVRATREPNPMSFLSTRDLREMKKSGEDGSDAPLLTLDGGPRFPMQSSDGGAVSRGSYNSGVEPKGYISREGHARLVEELSRLRSVERPKIVEEVSAAAAQGDRSENAEYIYGKKKLREIDRRTRFLEKRLDSLQVMDADQPREKGRCYFGAWVTVEDEEGRERVYRILGVDEVDMDRGVISYVSPLGRALLGKREGDDVIVKSPSGDREWSVTRVQYGASGD
jgi:transcription elongation factor GreB